MASSLSTFLAPYSAPVQELALALREAVLALLPDVQEQIDGAARMIAYCYGQRYIDMVCTLIPSAKGLKLGFYRGADLPDPDGLLEGTGKLSRYVVIKDEAMVRSAALSALVTRALEAYRRRMKP